MHLEQQEQAYLAAREAAQATREAAQATREADLLANDPTINEGATLICEEILAGVSEETMTLFKEMDAFSKIYSFVSTKAIYIYTWGSRKEMDLPKFFKQKRMRKF